MAKKEIDLAEALAETLNKQSKTQKVAYFLDEDDAATNVKDWVSTGCDTLDLAISNRPHGGLPVGRIIEINGLEGTGKSLVAAHTLANTQKKGGVAVLIDTETAVSREFFEAIGVDVSKLLYVSADCVEEIFEYIESIIEKARSTSKDKIVTIVVDSVAAASTKAELEADYDKDGYATGKSIIISKALRKITNTIGRENVLLVFTNQLREKLNAMAFSDKFTSPGGKALGFHASVRLRLKNMGTIKTGKTKENPNPRSIGINVRCTVTKNRMAPPLRSADFAIYFDRGIENNESWLDVMVENRIAKKVGQKYTYVDETTGEEIEFTTKEFPQRMLDNPELKERIYQKICTATMSHYRTDGISLDDDDVDIDTSETFD